MYKVNKVHEDTWIIEEQGVRFFLLAGEKEALLIDSGMMVKNARDIAESLTSLPVSLMNTHADRDHVGSNDQFEFAYMSPSELSNYHSSNKNRRIKPVWDGDVFDLGNRKLRIIGLPGHTPGSIAILDEKYRVLISGDPIQDGGIYMFGVQRNMEGYLHSLVRLQGYESMFDEIWPSHSTCPVGKDIIGRLIDAAKVILEGDIEVVDKEMHGHTISDYDAGVAHFYLDK